MQSYSKQNGTLPGHHNQPGGPATERNKMTVRSNHNSLLNYFLYDKKDLSPAYVRKCEEFIDSLGSSKLADCFKMEKSQAPSSKPQAASVKLLPQSDSMMDPLQKINRKKLKKL